MQTNLYWQKADQWVPGDKGGRGDERADYPGQKESSVGHGCIYHTDYGDRSAGVIYISELRKFNVCTVWYVISTSLKIHRSVTSNTQSRSVLDQISDHIHQQRISKQVQKQSFNLFHKSDEVSVLSVHRGAPRASVREVHWRQYPSSRIG